VILPSEIHPTQTNSDGVHPNISYVFLLLYCEYVTKQSNPEDADTLYFIAVYDNLSTGKMFLKTSAGHPVVYLLMS